MCVFYDVILEGFIYAATQRYEDHHHIKLNQVEVCVCVQEKQRVFR